MKQESSDIPVDIEDKDIRALFEIAERKYMYTLDPASYTLYTRALEDKEADWDTLCLALGKSLMNGVLVALVNDYLLLATQDK